MDVSNSRKRKLSSGNISGVAPIPEGQEILTYSRQRRHAEEEEEEEAEDESTDVKLAMLASLCACDDAGMLLEALLAADGSVERASALLNSKEADHEPPQALPANNLSPRKKYKNAALGYQSSLFNYALPSSNGLTSPTKKPVLLTKKGKTLHLYNPEDIAAHTPCSIIHNFLPPEQADALLRELVNESPTFKRDNFQLFERTVTSPHTFGLYMDSLFDEEGNKLGFSYNGQAMQDVRQSLPEMLTVSKIVQKAVNDEVLQRIKTHYPGQKKLKYQSSKPWTCNAAFVNCYDGPQENVGYHTDQLTNIGPRAVIGSLSLGVTREFRIRKIVPPDEPSDTGAGAGAAPDSATQSASSASAPTLKEPAAADASGQIAIHLPHNSLLVMHADMQEEWKHSIAPAQTVEPHPIAGNKRINITYRGFRKWFQAKYTPRCRCGVPTILKCVQKRRETRGRYMWMCDVGYVPGKKSCGYFAWAEFDDEGEPPWSKPEAEASLMENGLLQADASINSNTKRVGKELSNDESNKTDADDYDGVDAPVRVDL